MRRYLIGPIPYIYLEQNPVRVDDNVHILPHAVQPFNHSAIQPTLLPTPAPSGGHWASSILPYSITFFFFLSLPVRDQLPTMPEAEGQVMPDSLINKDDGRRFWHSQTPDDNAMIGGSAAFPNLSQVDLDGSRNFLVKVGIGKGLRIIGRALEGGAGYETSFLTAPQQRQPFSSLLTCRGRHC